MSPIIGLTDQVKAAFPRIGRLRKGGEATRDNTGKVLRIGQDLSFFRFTSERPEVQEAFDTAYGPSPALINVYLPHATVEGNFDSWQEAWVGGGMVHRCDGETMTIWLGPDGKHHKTEKPCDGGCKPVGRLSLWIPELVQAGFIGYVTLETHGINDLLSIQGSLMAALEARGGHPDGLRGIQWTLKRIKEKISTPGQNGKRARRDKWMVKLEPAAAWITLQLETSNKAAMMQLPAPRIDEDGVIHDTEPDLDDVATADEIGEHEAPDDVEEAEFSEAPGATVPEPQDEAAHKTDMRERITAKIRAQGLTKKKVEEMSLEHGGTIFAELSLDGLIALSEALAEKAS